MISFSNTNDGLLIVGVDDKTRKVYVTEGALLVRKGTPEYREWADTTVTVLHPAEVIIAKEEIFLEGLSERQKKAMIVSTFLWIKYYIITPLQQETYRVLYG